MNADLLRELVEYRTSKQKSVMMASRSILQLYRIINPEMLPRKERVFKINLCAETSLSAFFWYHSYFYLFYIQGPTNRSYERVGNQVKIL
jgi:hypothetical protein